MQAAIAPERVCLPLIACGCSCTGCDVNQPGIFVAQRRWSAALVDTVLTGMNKPANPPPDLWLTEQELADLLRISLRHLINLRKAGLPHVMLGAVVRYDLPEVLAHLKKHRHLASRTTDAMNTSGERRP